MGTWKEQVVWEKPRSLHDVIHGPQGRTVIPATRGYYAFVEGKTTPSPNRWLYIGIAAGKTGLYGRLSSYLRTTVTVSKASHTQHTGKRRLFFARIVGINGSAVGLGGETLNTPIFDKSIYLSWALAPFDFDSETKGRNEREFAYMLERALIHYYRPLYNTANWERDNEFDLEDDAF